VPMHIHVCSSATSQHVSKDSKVRNGAISHRHNVGKGCLCSYVIDLGVGVGSKGGPWPHGNVCGETHEW